MPLDSCLYWKIVIGILQISVWDPEGDKVVVGVCGNGDIVSSKLFNFKRVILECITPVEAVEISREDWLYLGPDLISCIQKIQQYIHILQHRRIYPRLVHLLIWLANRFGQRLGENFVVSIPFTHHELGELIGTTRVTVTRILQMMERERILHRQDGRVLVLHYHPIRALDLSLGAGLLEDAS
ncbi:MAG: Crp/Fnr family transcriptional regulator [Synechococcaceae cyanobacterium SM2_3_2]|nr:Crp/Fnr family transcriptional regulator [Synechococcaceae cyanobacterium SM2_3_2]